MGSAVPGVVHDDQRVPLPRPKPVPRAHTTPLLPADLGQERWLKHGGGEKRGGGGIWRQTDRRWSGGGTGSRRCRIGTAGGGGGAALGKGGYRGRMELGCKIRGGSWAGWVSSLRRVALPPGASFAKNTVVLLVQA